MQRENFLYSVKANTSEPVTGEGFSLVTGSWARYADRLPRILVPRILATDPASASSPAATPSSPVPTHAGQLPNRKIFGGARPTGNRIAVLDQDWTNERHCRDMPDEVEKATASRRGRPGYDQETVLRRAIDLFNRVSRHQR